jgi:hypothetical protein
MNQPVPPYLTKPYETVRERAYATAVVIRYWQLIEQLMILVDRQPDAWPTNLRRLFPSSVPGGPPEHPQQRLERWFAVYADEINILRAIRDQLVHGVDVSDVDLRGADFVARVILAALFDMPPTGVNENWAIEKISDINREMGMM